MVNGLMEKLLGVDRDREAALELPYMITNNSGECLHAIE